MQHYDPSDRRLSGAAMPTAPSLPEDDTARRYSQYAMDPAFYNGGAPRPTPGNANPSLYPSLGATYNSQSFSNPSGVTLSALLPPQGSYANDAYNSSASLHRASLGPGGLPVQPSFKAQTGVPPAPSTCVMPPPGPLYPGGVSLRGGFEPITPQTGPMMAPMMPGAAAGLNGMGGASATNLPTTPSSIVDLHFRCKNLKKADVFSESDPFVVVYVEQSPGKWFELGRTETVVNSANPTFTKAIEIDYFFEELQRVRLEIFDRDSPSEVLTKHDFLGCTEFTLAYLMSSNGHSLMLPLAQSPQRRGRGITGHIFVDAEEAAMCGDMVQVKFAAEKLDNKDGWFGKSDPFINIYRLKDEQSDPATSTSWVHVWRSKVVMNNLNPAWPQVMLAVRTLCNGNLSRLLKFECMDWEESGRHQLIGSATVVAAEFVSGERRSLDLINPERQRKKGKKYKNSGVLKIASIQSFKQHTFAEYLRGGCEISLIVGIDFTASNGMPTDPRSLHYTGNTYLGQHNDYQAAILSTGSILEAYDHDKRFPVYGFGALVNGQVNHCFPLTLNPQQPEVEHVDGILQVYSNVFPFLQLHGPTYFAPLIHQAATIARVFSQADPLNPNNSLKYFVLLIITDGAIMDMEATVEKIVEASQLPLSIVIVGVGNADFSSMDQLDSDDRLLKARSGRTAARDIVQFVPFNRYRNNPARLAKETLAEIPQQLTQHFRARNIAPRPPLARMGTEALMLDGSRRSFTSSSTQV